MLMQSLRDGAAGGLLKFILFTVLGMAVGGLVLSEMAGTNSVGSNDVARIADKTISLQQFDSTLRRALSGYNMPVEQAYKIGLTQDILAGEIRSHFLQTEAKNLGIEIGRDHIAENIAQVVKPHVREDMSLQQTLEDLLRRQGMSEKEFVAGIRRELSGNILMDALKSGFAPQNDLLAQDLLTFQTQTRDIGMILFPDEDIKSVKPATEEQLTRLYESTKRLNYKIPEYRRTDMAVFDIAAMDRTFSVSADEVKQAYNENIDNFKIGEQFVLSQALVQDEKQADAIYALVRDGKDLKAATLEVTQDSARYLEHVPFEHEVMLPALREALKDRDIGRVVAPVKTTLGHHVVKLVNIIPPSVKPLNTVEGAVRKELLEAKKADYLYGVAERFEEFLADGTDFAAIAKEINITVLSLDFIDANGLNKDGADGLDMFTAQDKQAVAGMVFELEGRAPSPMLEVDGKFVAFALKDRQDEAFRPFESVKDEMAAQFIADQQRLENARRMKTYLAELETGGSTLEGLAKESGKKIQQITGITLDGDLVPPLTDAARSVLFKTAPGGYESLALEGQSALIKVTGYDFPENTEPDALETLKTGLDTEAGDEAFLMYLHALSEKYPATINERLLGRVYGRQDGAL